jgi:hypothetical protein
MPKDPKGRRRPADVITNAVHVMRIATSEIEEPPDTRNQAALTLSRLGASKGGKARAKSLSASKRKEISARGVKARWRG